MEHLKQNKNLTLFEIEHLAKCWLGSKRFNVDLPEPLNSRDAHFFLYGRNALYAILHTLKKERGYKKILFAAYSCGDEIQPAATLGYDISFFKLAQEKGLQIDAEDLLKILKGFKGVLIITHYLGFIQRNINIIADYCKKNGIILIENCTHCLGTRYLDQAIGTFGDYAIFSLRKNMPLPHGGALVVNNKNVVSNLESILSKNFHKPSSEAVIFDLFIFLGYQSRLLRYGVNISKTLKDFSVNQSLHGPRLDVYGGYNLRLSYLAEAIIPYVNWESIMNIKKRNFQRYLNYFKKNKMDNFVIVEKILSNEYPMLFPIYVKNSESFYKKVKHHDIFGIQPFWSHKHKFVNWKIFQKESIIKKGILVLPTTYFIGNKNLEIISKELHSI